MTQPITSPSSAKLLRAALWVAIGALIAAAIICVVWVLLGDSDGMIGKAFLTILLLAGFAGVAILEAGMAPRREAWLSLTSMTTWILTLLIGAFFIWMPDGSSMFGGFERMTRFLVIIVVLQLALLHAWLFTKAHRRYPISFTSIVTYVTLALVGILAMLLVLPLMLDEWVDFGDLYWRIVVALAILAAVGTALVPLINALFAPKKQLPRPPGPGAGAYAAPVSQPWPTYVDGVTPLPVLPDGTPDWNAYYTGQPTYPYGAPTVPAPPIASPQPLAPGPVAPAPASAPVAPTPGAPASAPPAPAPAAPAPAHPAPADPAAAPPQPEQTGYQGYPAPPAPPS
ncbi:hypothetical protein [Microbacterium sp.]|uniref:hypothetical protein n=1 Tax=Microbacterium sp. TaxID=51671 RepID=UPI003A890F17